MRSAVCLLGLVLMATPVFAGERALIVYYEQFQPFSWIENGKMKGILVDVLEEALSKRMGLKIVHEGYPWARAQEMVRHGQADAFCTVPTPQRLEYAKASAESVVTVTFTLFTAKDGAAQERLREVRSLGELKSFTLAHYTGSGWARQNLEGLNVHWAPMIEDVLRMLAAKRVDAFIDVSQVVRFYVKKYGFEDAITELPYVFEQNDFKLLIGNHSPSRGILPVFDAAIREMRQDGTLERIYSAYR